MARISSTHSDEFSDTILESLEDEYQLHFRNAMPFGIESDDPFDLEVAKPRALDLRHLYALAGSELPATILATLGPRVPILICHGMTPFYKPGGRPVGVWGMGYEVRLNEVDAATVGFFPESKLIDVASTEQRVTFGVQVGGEIGLPKEELELVNQLPGLAITGAKLLATTDQRFALAINSSFSLVETQAGPIDAGGARWNLYRAKKRIDVFQPLFHTVLVPSGTHELQLSVSTWIRRSGRYFSWTKSRQWQYPIQRFNISLAGIQKS